MSCIKGTWSPCQGTLGCVGNASLPEHKVSGLTDEGGFLGCLGKRKTCIYYFRAGYILRSDATGVAFDDWTEEIFVDNVFSKAMVSLLREQAGICLRKHEMD